MASSRAERAYWPLALALLSTSASLTWFAISGNETARWTLATLIVIGAAAGVVLLVMSERRSQWRSLNAYGYAILMVTAAFPVGVVFVRTLPGALAILVAAGGSILGFILLWLGWRTLTSGSGPKPLL